MEGMSILLPKSVVTYHRKREKKLQFHCHNLIRNTWWKRPLSCASWWLQNLGRRHKDELFHYQEENCSNNTSFLCPWLFLTWMRAITVIGCSEINQLPTKVQARKAEMTTVIREKSSGVESHSVLVWVNFKSSPSVSCVSSSGGGESTS